VHSLSMVMFASKHDVHPLVMSLMRSGIAKRCTKRAGAAENEEVRGCREASSTQDEQRCDVSVGLRGKAGVRGWRGLPRQPDPMYYIIGSVITKT
jgi:hypothetical protein